MSQFLLYFFNVFVSLQRIKLLRYSCFSLNVHNAQIRVANVEIWERLFHAVANTKKMLQACFNKASIIGLFR